jgi:hypothetical protein
MSPVCYIVKHIPVQVFKDPEDFRRLRLLGFLDSRHMKVVKLKAVSTGRLYPSREGPWYSFLLEAESTPRAIVRPEG